MDHGQRRGKRKAWIVDYADGSGERHIQTFSRKKDADDYHATVKVDVRKGLHTAPSRSVTVAEAAEDLDQAGRGGWPGGGHSGAVHCNTQRNIFCHNSDGTSWQNSATRQSRTSATTCWRTCPGQWRGRCFTQFQVDAPGHQVFHLADDVRISTQRREKPRLEVGRDIPTPGEIRRLIEASTPGHQRAMFLIAATCGLRASELRGLRWRDIDLKEATLRVTQRADRFGTIGPPKSAAGRREIPLAPETLAELKTWKLACPKTDGDLVFPSQSGRVSHHVNLFRSVERLQRRAKVIDKDGKPKYGLHSFRHFFASWCLNRKPEGRELRPQEVQSLLGHASIVMTLDVYGHLFPRQSDRAELAASSKALLLG